MLMLLLGYKQHLSLILSRFSRSSSFRACRIWQITYQDRHAASCPQTCWCWAPSAADALTFITIKRNSAIERTDARDKLAPAISHELVKYSQSHFCSTVHKHIFLSQAAELTAYRIEDIVREHEQPFPFYNSEITLKLTFAVCDLNSLFRDGCALLCTKFPAMTRFSEVSSTKLPRTTTVEADFFRLRHQKNGFRQNVSALELESVLHAQLHKQLQIIVLERWWVNLLWISYIALYVCIRNTDMPVSAKYR